WRGYAMGLAAIVAALAIYEFLPGLPGGSESVVDAPVASTKTLPPAAPVQAIPDAASTARAPPGPPPVPHPPPPPPGVPPNGGAGRRRGGGGRRGQGGGSGSWGHWSAAP